MDTTLSGVDSLDEADGGRPRLELAWVFPELRYHPLDVGQGPWRIGRGDGCEIVIADRLASREHARILRKGPLVVLEDLDSRNGTFVQGAVARHIPLRVGTVIRIGNCVGIIVEKFRDEASVGQAGSNGSPAVVLEEPLPGYFVGPTSGPMLEPVRRAAASDLPLLIQGATGTGKEKVAEYVHHLSQRAGPFHAVNCAAIPPEVAESQLFGHRSGAFTGAKEHHIGHFRAAQSGTLFLDEVTELPLAVQAKLLRTIQEQKVMPLGETKAVSIDVRIVASCQHPLVDAVAAGAFRADLQARLSGLVVNLPTLAERMEELPALFLLLLGRHAKRMIPRVGSKFVERLCLYDWPGNVRELELVARQLLAVHGHEPRLKERHLPLAIRQARSARDGEANANGSREVERLVCALRNAGGNITRASASLGISRTAAYRLMAGQSIPDLIARYPERGRN